MNIEAKEKQNLVWILGLFKNSNLLWLFIVLLILLPTTFGRLIIDIAGGLLIFLILTPILIGGAGWIGWKIIQSKIIKKNQRL